MISPIVAMLVPLAARRIEFGNRVKFAFVLDEMTTVKVNDFQSLPSVLREYGVSFLVLTQSGTKFDKLYGKEDRVSIMANFANLFLGKTKDVEALKYYPLFLERRRRKRKVFPRGPVPDDIIVVLPRANRKKKFMIAINSRNCRKENLYFLQESLMLAELKHGLKNLSWMRNRYRL